MSSNYNFDDIRPYRDHELKELIPFFKKDEAFLRVLNYLYGGDTSIINSVLKKLESVTTITDFQMEISRPIMVDLINKTSTELTASGAEKLDKDKNYLFMSNHRDIILDPVLINIELNNFGFRASEVAIGSNLLIFPWIEHLVRINRCFVVKRNIPVKQMLEASAKMSEYIRNTIKNRDVSVWIAQKEGRTKDGLDKTQTALLKMLNISNSSSSASEGFKELNLVPISISYEIEPCGNEKIVERYTKKYDPTHTKTDQDDLQNMASGLSNNKGRIHFHFGDPIALDEIAYEKNKNKQIKWIESEIDKQIYANYKLWPNNFIAYDLSFNTDKYSDRYTSEEKDAFDKLTQERFNMKHVKSDQLEEMIQMWNHMYAAPISNKEKYDLSIE